MKYNVFLGGSCNPTTWRNDVALPFLKAHLITYYNPQVSDWNDSLIHSEFIAKLSSDILLFVIDDETNAVASMVEAAHYIGKGRRVVLCVKMITEDSYIDGYRLPPTLRQDLNRGRSYLVDFAKHSNIPVFKTISEALEKVLILLRSQYFPSRSREI